MSENELILMILFLAALLAVFILVQKNIALKVENDALWKQVYMNDVKARSWDRLLEMKKSGAIKISRSAEAAHEMR